MNKNDQDLLKKMIGTADISPVDKIASAFVNVDEGEVKYQSPIDFHRIDDSEADLYSNIFKKGISGKIGTTGIELPVANDNLLQQLMNDSFSEDVIQEIYSTIQSQYNASDNYGIFICRGYLDASAIPLSLKKKNGLTDSAGSELHYDFVLVLVSQCTADRPGIMYDYQGNIYKDKLTQNDLKSPTCAFLYPSFTETAPDVDHAMCFAKNAKTAYDMADIASALFNAETSSTPEEQTEGFKAMIDSAFPRRAPYEPMQKLFDYFGEIAEDSKLNGENAVLSANELADALVDCCGIKEDDALPIRETAEAYQNIDFSVDNLAPKNITIDSDYAVIKTDLNDISEIKKKTIDGQDYLLIPARNVSIESVKVK